MKQQPTKEQVLDALQTHKRIYKAALAMGVSVPTFRRYMKKYDIQLIHIQEVKQTPEQPLPLYKRILKKLFKI